MVVVVYHVTIVASWHGLWKKCCSLLIGCGLCTAGRGRNSLQAGSGIFINLWICLPQTMSWATLSFGMISLVFPWSLEFRYFWPMHLLAYFVLYSTMWSVEAILMSLLYKSICRYNLKIFLLVFIFKIWLINEVFMIYISAKEKLLCIRELMFTLKSAGLSVVYVWIYQVSNFCIFKGSRKKRFF